MDTNYAMAKFGLESKDILRSRQKGCWHYMKYFFIFSSIIQFLIILGLVLFMLYGNAHGGTETRLQSLETRFYAQTREKDFLQGNFTQLKSKYAAQEKQLLNCSTILAAKNRVMLNMTRVPFVPTRTGSIPSPDICKTFRDSADSINITCINDKLRLQNRIYQLELEFSKYKENNGKSIIDLTDKERKASGENEKLQREKTDLERQQKLLQESCTDIDSRFKREIEQMKINFDTALKPYDTYTSVRCRPVTDSITNSIDHALARLRQDVNNVMLENSQLKVNQGRSNEDLRKCNQDKDAISAQNTKLTVEKGAIEKQLEEKKDEQNKLVSRYMKKEEDLETCRKAQVRPAYTGYTG